MRGQTWISHKAVRSARRRTLLTEVEGLVGEPTAQPWASPRIPHETVPAVPYGAESGPPMQM
jgi:hypothetical protein